MMKRLLTASSVLLIAAGAMAQPEPAKPAPATEAPKAQPKPDERAFDLMVGDKAPALAIEKWVKGDTVTGFEKGKVYVVEFWATWCGPCVMSMPHLSQVQKEYRDKGVTIIGVTAKDTRGNTLDAVQEMVTDKGDTMGYTVAWDTGRKTNEAYMEAAGQQFIPTAFVVDKAGIVAYIGNPSYLDKPLEEIVAGTYDVKAAAAKYAKKMEPQAKMARIQRKLRAATAAKDWPAALAAYDEMAVAEPSQAGEFAIAKFSMMLLTAKDYDKAYAIGREAMKANDDDEQALNAIAWTIVDPKNNIEKKDLDLALSAATRADTLTDHEDAAIIDTVARVYWLKGDKAKAIELQTKAVGLADAPMKKELQATLDEYKKDAGKN